ncbi:4a-hydroxytetrahydrobiopterin dehydratase [Thermithiobacillus tepidarius DSM 3134]|uniref:4a-hydroxytetrahydrobiopterin dehydratase n=1 Tax=Thermithiobacillus tepidarius TaxID=929 RepID=UPI0005720508|nr:4a-hydroxytetrahydrobiopterin dehydratase [Thermithiobacillus tepidarius]
MSIEQALDNGWQVHQRPAQLTRRFDFSSYSETRAFLDRLAELSERTGIFPNLNFAKTHVNVAIVAQGAMLVQDEIDFALQANALAGQGSGQS